MVHKGSCHCGGIAFEVEGEITGGVTCNCSICQRKGAVMWFVTHDQFKLKTPETAMSTYTFNKHVINHRFCPTCGMHPFGEGTAPGGKRMLFVNLRCVEDIDLDAVPVKSFNGRAL